MVNVAWLRTLLRSHSAPSKSAATSLHHFATSILEPTSLPSVTPRSKVGAWLERGRPQVPMASAQVPPASAPDTLPRLPLDSLASGVVARYATGKSNWRSALPKSASRSSLASDASGGGAIEQPRTPTPFSQPAVIHATTEEEAHEAADAALLAGLLQAGARQREAMEAGDGGGLEMVAEAPVGASRDSVWRSLSDALRLAGQQVGRALSGCMLAVATTGPAEEQRLLNSRGG